MQLVLDRSKLRNYNESTCRSVQVCEIENLPLTDPSARAVPLSPKAWREKLETRCQSEEKDELNNVKKFLLLDVRNSMFLFPYLFSVMLLIP